MYCTIALHRPNITGNLAFSTLIVLFERESFVISGTTRYSSITSIPLENMTVLITPPRIPTGLRDSSRIPTRILLDFNEISKKVFSHIFSIPSYWTPIGLLLDSYWTPTGLQLNLNNVNAMLQTLDSYWIPTGLLLEYHAIYYYWHFTYLTTLCNLLNHSINILSSHTWKFHTKCVERCGIDSYIQQVFY